MHAVWRTARNLSGPLLLALAGVGLAFAFFIYVRNDLEQDALLRFESQAADANHIIERRLRTYVDVTHGLKALFEAKDSISRAEFHRYVASLRLKEQYPGFVQLNYARHVRGSEKSSLEASVRADRSMSSGGYPDFRVRPGGERPEYHVLIYIEPMEKNEHSFGLDIRMVGLRGAAMDNLRESTSVISSGRPLVLGDPPFIGVGMRLPLYRADMPRETEAQRRAAFIGSVGAGVNVRYLMSGVLDETTMTAMRYRVHDAGPLGNAGGQESRLKLIYDSAQPGPGAPKEDFAMPGPGRTFGVILPLQFAGRDWRLHFSAPADAFIDRTDARLPFLVLAGGLLCAGLLFAVVYAFASSRQRAVALAADITRELRGSEASLAHAQALARLGSWTLDLGSERMAWSAETYRLLELEPTASPPRLGAFLSPLLREDREAFRAAAARCVETGAPARLELPLRLAGSGTRWVHFIIQPVGEPGDAQVRGTITDVTERKRALEVQRENAAQIRDLLRRLVHAQESERRRFSADLHDLVGQSLSVLGMGLETIRAQTAGGQRQKAEATFNDMGQLLKETMVAVREVMSDLRPPLLDDYGLYAAIEWHARQMETRTGLRVEVGGEKLEPRPPVEVEVALFRIAQEALTNVAKHARAARARISLASEAGRVRLVVEDDGCGVGTPAANDAEELGWGMAVMRERAAAVGGSMHVESPGQGTRIVVEVATR